MGCQNKGRSTCSERQLYVSAGSRWFCSGAHVDDKEIKCVLTLINFLDFCKISIAYALTPFGMKVNLFAI